MTVSEHRERLAWRPALPRRHSLPWVVRYQGRMVAADASCGMLAAAIALLGRFAGQPAPFLYLATTAGLPLAWIGWLALAGGYDPRFIGLGPEEFRRILGAAASLTATIAIASYALDADFARGYVLIALPGLTAATALARFGLRKQLHRRREHGLLLRRVTAVGPADAVADLIVRLHRERHHGLEVVNACVAGTATAEVAGVPVLGGLADAARVAAETGTDTVAVLACPGLDGATLRQLAWELEKEGTDLCLAPALLDVAGPRTTIRPAAGLTLLHVDHPELTGLKRAVKGIFDRVTATAALCLLAPVLAVIAIAIVVRDGGPVLCSQTRIGQDGLPFEVLKFRTMVTVTGKWLRRWSLDGLPQLFNVVRGEMSLVGPRPPLPSEVTGYGHDVRRRLLVKPGLTGLWQVSGRSDLSREEAVRLDLRYVENWSLALDLQILWKTGAAAAKGRGAS